MSAASDVPRYRVEPMWPGHPETLWQVVAPEGDVIAESLTLNDASMAAEAARDDDAARAAAEEPIPSYDPGAADGGRASAQAVEAYEEREAVRRSHSYLEGRADGAHLIESFSAAIIADQEFDAACRARDGR